MDKNLMIIRTKKFTLDCFRLAEEIPNSYLSYHIRDQFVRSASSVSANYRAAQRAQTKNGFIAKLSIVLEEVDEAQHWLEILEEAQILSNNTQLKCLWQEANELISILIATRKKLRST